MTAVRFSILPSILAAGATCAIAADAAFVSPETLEKASAHGLLALLACLSIALAWWSMKRVFAQMEATNAAINRLADELKARPCFYDAKKN